ncbi:M3 family oligoendopeptidase [Bacillus sp. 1P06AnD]|uniref:M3 family oligoendopeptidase n=1 Tax=Bacillus sp. 1P06AnD TaxID=3132208 RepID=UPI0039A17049
MPEIKKEGFYYEDIECVDLNELENRCQLLLQREILSVEELKTWLHDERQIESEIEEALTGRMIEFFQDTTNFEKKERYLNGQKTLQPLLLKYRGEFDRKFCGCPFKDHLSDEAYGFMKKARKKRNGLLIEANIPLTLKEQELISAYGEMMGSLSADWNGEMKPYAFVKSKLNSPDREMREQAWRELGKSRSRIKPDIDRVMNELVQLRHQMAINAGFKNYRDYIFEMKGREFTVQDCYKFHESVEKLLVPAWGKLALGFQQELQVDTYRPWDYSHSSLKQIPFTSFSELLDGVQKMLGKSDPYFEERFNHMREKRLFDLDDRKGKAPGGACFTLPKTKNSFIFANFSPSFIALNALIHELGHALHFYLQFDHVHGFQEQYLREEVAELYSHSLELLLLDKIGVFYPDDGECRKAQREIGKRSFMMLINPVAGDLFQHWMYTNPHHTTEERDNMYVEINKRYKYAPIDIKGFEADVSSSWMESVHYIQYPFYKIEYAISQIGALQLYMIYRENPDKAIALFKKGAGTSQYAPIPEIYQNTGIEFDFSRAAIKRVSGFVNGLIEEWI